MAARLAWLSAPLAAAALLGLPAMAAAIGGLGERVRARAARGQAALADLAAHLAAVLGAREVVRAFRAEQYEARRFRRLARGLRAERLAAERLRAAVPAAVTALYALTVLAVLAGGCWAVRTGALSPEGLGAFLAALVLLIEPLQGGATAFNELKQGQAAVDRLFAPLTRPAVDDAADDGADEAADSLEGGEPEELDVRFEGVGFAYAGRPGEVLADATFRVAPGEKVALVGRSGSGKSTVGRLLLGLLAPSRGRILLGGREVRALGPDRRAALLAWVPADARLLRGSVAENILYGVAPPHGAADIRRMEAAARLARAAGFVAALPAGYATEVGPGGAALSAGQRQRVALARALARRPRVLVCDEATASLDPATAAEVQRSLLEGLPGCAVLIIAHRRDALAGVDRVLRLEGGRVVEEEEEACET